MYLKYHNYADFIKENRIYNRHECPTCKGLRELSIEDLDITIENRKMYFKDFLVLTCLKCGENCLPQHSKQMVDGCYKIMIRDDHFEGIQKYTGYKKKFMYCSQQDFNYDHRDYYNIPGLCYDEEDSEEGFLTPVYFTKNVLIYFMHHPEYKMNLFSESYGVISCKEEWNVPFGINRNGKVFFWLGDLNLMDITSLEIMKPHNVDSDHKLIDSEFYAAQLCCIWSEPNKELKACYKKKDLFDLILKRYGINLFHLEDEIEQQMRDFDKPVIITKKSIEVAINMLHKVLIEGVNIKSFRELYVQLYKHPEKGYKEWKSIKFYQKLLEKIVSDQEKVKEIIAPLYLINDLRQYYDHLLPNEKKEDIEANVKNSLGIDSFEQIDLVYDGIINRLNTLFQYLVIEYSGD